MPCPQFWIRNLVIPLSGKLQNKNPVGIYIQPIQYDGPCKGRFYDQQVLCESIYQEFTGDTIIINYGQIASIGFPCTVCDGTFYYGFFCKGLAKQSKGDYAGELPISINLVRAFRK